MNYAQRFRYNTITQKYALFNNLWQKKLRVKEEGYRRPQDALLAIQGVREFENKVGRKGKNGTGEFRIQCSDPEAEKEKVRALFDAMVEAKKRAGAKANAAGTFESFQAFVKKKTDQIRKEQKCGSVEYSVEMNDGESIAGVIADESASGVTLKWASGGRRTIARQDVKKIAAESGSMKKPPTPKNQLPRRLGSWKLEVGS